MPPKLNAHFLCYESQFNFQEIPQFVGGIRYNTHMTTKWNKYTHVCHTCDALIEYTSTRNVTDITCECGGVTGYLSVQDATILPTTTKEETVETTSAFLESKIAELESTLKNHQNCDYWKAENGRIGQQVISLINDAYDEDAEASDILERLCEIIDYNPTKTIQFEGVIHFSGSIDVPRHEQDGFDLTSALEDVYVDINNGDVVIDNYDLYSVEEPY